MWYVFQKLKSKIDWERRFWNVRTFFNMSKSGHFWSFFQRFCALVPIFQIKKNFFLYALFKVINSHILMKTALKSSKKWCCCLDLKISLFEKSPFKSEPYLYYKSRLRPSIKWINLYVCMYVCLYPIRISLLTTVLVRSAWNLA